MKTKKKTIYCLALFFIIFFCCAEVKIDKSSRIVFDQRTAIESEKTAAEELKIYLGKIFRSDFGIFADSPGNKIVVGHHRDLFGIISRREIETLGEEEFIIRSDSRGNVYIAGGRPRGTLYGVYHFLDNLLGVHWYSPEYEYVPKKEQFTFKELNLREKPAFDYRKRPCIPTADRKISPLWCARNRFNDPGFLPAKMKKELLVPYGGGVYYAPPFPCHTMPHLFPAKKIAAEHPEWLALKKGKREYHSKVQFLGYCLSNEDLLKATIEKVRANFRACPESKYISISEGDGSGVCECTECQKIIADHGGKNSALWLHFVNQIADAVRDEFPDKLIGTLAYTHTAAPPENMTARDNVLVWLCVWGKWRGYPYQDPKNDRGFEFMQDLKKWTGICKNVHIWDYMSTYDNVLRPMPDLRNNIINMRNYKLAGVSGLYIQALNVTFESGAPFKYWAQGRCSWNPEQNYESLLKTFCNEYYGEKAGKYIYEYWIHMESVNAEAGFYKINLSGWEGVAPHADRTNTLYADSLFRKAIAETEDPVLLTHIELAYAPVQFLVLQNWKDWEKEGNLPGSLDFYYGDLMRKAEKYDLRYNEARMPLKKILPALYRIAQLKNVEVKVSNIYGSTPYAAFDGDDQTPARFGNYSGWIQAEFKENRSLSDIELIFGKNTCSVTYEIKASSDGEKWVSLVPKKTVSREKFGTPFICSETFRKISCKFVRVHVYRSAGHNGKATWSSVCELRFNKNEATPMKE